MIPLRSVFLHVTKACNFRCSYCYFSAAKPLPDEMSTAELARLWPDLVALAPRKVIFTGGEPLLRGDLADLLRGLRDADPDHRVIRCLNSNGALVTPELAHALVGLADEVRISVDALPARNDGLRGEGSFAVALRALQIYRAAGFEPKALVTVTASSLPDLEDLICFLFDHRITRINVNGFRPVGRGKGHDGWRVDMDEVRAAVARAWIRCRPGRPRPVAPPESDTQGHCGAGEYLNIMPDGDVFPCHVLTGRAFRCGNVRTDSLRQICRRGGLLDRLQSLDFRDLARQDAQLAPLARLGACLGDVHAQTRSCAVWKDNLGDGRPCTCRAASSDRTPGAG
jgi:MoaA/NifB/PqqE/SkfB family radical SAM enzyme